MIRKLRRKFVAITMALVGVVLLGVCAVLFFTSYRQQVIATQNSLRHVLEQSQSSMENAKPQIARKDDAVLDALDPQGPNGRDGGPFGWDSTVTFWVLLDDSGAIADRDISRVDITDATLAALADEVAASGKEQGTLSNPDLRFLARQTPSGLKIAFADRSNELSAMRTLLLRLAAVCAAAALALFGVSVFLARLAVRPVSVAWEQQRQFVADASHELKTPLTVIMADASILAAHPQDTVAAQKKWVDGIQAEGTRMKKLIDDLLFLAKSDAARAPLTLCRVDLSDIVMSGALSFESVAFETGVTIFTKVAPNLFLQGDSGQMKQLVAILVDNACKYADGKKEVRVQLAPGPDRKSAVLRVENTGADIPAAELPHLFERFYRTDSSRARSAGGYGLGLAIARTIAEQHHGTIRAESGGGVTAFSVVLPLLGGATSARA